MIKFNHRWAIFVEERGGEDLNKESLGIQRSTDMKVVLQRRRGFMEKAKFEILQNWGLYLLLLPTLLYVIIFHYGPMYGVLIAFKDFSAGLGIMGSKWVGFKHFTKFLGSYNFWSLLKNTLTLSVYSLIAGFPIPIIFALFLNYVGNRKLQKSIQTISYAPHFISTVVLVGMLSVFLSPSTGLVNILLRTLGLTPVLFMGSAPLFKHIYVWSGIWQGTGWASIIYIASLAGISPELHEAAIVDGANKLRRIWHIDIPGIMPTAITLLILNTGSIMSVGFEKAFLMQNSLNLESSEIISTYVYKVGLLGAQFSYSSAVGLFNSVVGFILIIAVNYISKKQADISIW